MSRLGHPGVGEDGVKLLGLQILVVSTWWIVQRLSYVFLSAVIWLVVWLDCILIFTVVLCDWPIDEKAFENVFRCSWLCINYWSVFFSVTTLFLWHSGSALVSINKVNLRRARLVLGWVSVSRFSSSCRTFISVCNQPSRPTQPGHPFMGRRYKYQP